MAVCSTLSPQISSLDIPAQAPVGDSLVQGFAESHLLDVA